MKQLGNKKNEGIFPILIDGDPILREKCVEVTSKTKYLKSFLEKMHRTLEGTETGMGLASPQIGIGARIFIIGNTGTRRDFINPEIISKKIGTKKDYESCLSVPNIKGRVERYYKIVVKYYDSDWNEQIKQFKGFDARIIQHEIDHLNGIMYYDLFTPDNFFENYLEKMRKGSPLETVYLVKQNKISKT